MKHLLMSLMLSIPKKTLQKANFSGSKYIAKIKGNQKGLLSFVKEIEEVSHIDSDFQQQIKQSNDFIERNIYVYSNCIYPWSGIFISSIIRVDKIVNCGKTTTHYYISNDTDTAESFLKKILQEWSVETMHFYKDTALKEDKCKTNRGAFSFSILRSIVVNILHLNRIKNIGREIVVQTPMKCYLGSVKNSVSATISNT